jgi:hypothetical protein
MDGDQRKDLTRRVVGRRTGRVAVAAALGSLGLVLAVGVAPALAAGAHHKPKPHEFDMIYRGIGDYAYNSQLTADNGCTTVTDGNGEFAYDQEWDVTAKVKGEAVDVKQIDHVGGPEPIGGPGSGENRAHVEGHVFGAACPSAYLGSFNCDAAHLKPQSINDMIFSEKGSRFIITAEGISEVTGAITGSDTRAVDGESCSIFHRSLPTPNSAFGPYLDAWGKIPVKQATLANLKKRHHFKVSISAGHYTDGGPSNYNKNGCLGIEDHNPTDSCTVSQDDLTGIFSVRRIR